MPPSTQPPGRLLPWPGDSGPLLAAFWASLTTPIPDRPVPDRPVPDSAVPDRPVPDRPVPDSAVPDRPVPDRPVPDSAGPPRADWATAPDNAAAVLELAGLSDSGLLASATPAPVAPAGWPDGIVPPDGFPPPLPPTLSGPGFGFGQGDPLDLAAPGPGLAALAEDAHGVLAGIDNDALTGVIRAWRRISSWATGRELAAVAELARRYPADGLPGSGREYVADELAAALTLTGRAAQGQRDLAWQLANLLPATLAALAAGLIDLAKARVIAAGTAELTAGHAAAVEAAVLAKAPGQTTGELRAAVARAVHAADPDAATRQREAAQEHAHVSCWTGPSGTAHLEGHDLPPAQTLAADARLGQIAAAWKAHGAQGGADLLRAHAYLALLLGHDTTTPPASLLSPGHTPAHPADTTTTTTTSGGGGAPGTNSSPTPVLGAGRAGQPSAGLQPPPGLRPPAPEPGYPLPPVAAMINLTVPLATLQQLAHSPGDAAGYGPLAPDTARALACAAAGHPATRWQLTVTSPEGQALATGIARRRGHVPATGWTVTVEPVPTGDCDHHCREPGYRPSPALARLIRTRNATCCFPGCRRPARRCDVDHTVPYEDGGLTCACNLAPLCRRHHRLKQTEGWLLSQLRPGVLAWLTPSGRRYTTLPSQHPT